MDWIILDKPTETYSFVLFNTDEDEINIFCNEDDLSLLQKTRYLVTRMRYFGFEFYKLEKKNKIKTKKGAIINKNILIYRLKRCNKLKQIKKELDKDKEIKYIKQIVIKEPGRMIFLKKYILAKLGELRVENKEDYNIVIERLLPEDGN